MYGTGATTFVGVPIFKWVFLKPSLVHGPCILYNQNNGDMNYYNERFLVGLADTPHFYQKNNEKDFQNCIGARLIIDRRVNIQPSDCNYQCPSNAVAACSPHTVVYFSEHQFSHENPGKLQSGACHYGT
jgi:hypothetical protein